ncbi:hypothetical protein FPANT_7529 [Fusarium pseudoanthophilum]|uniref:Uncharacterized protein n=1 Tax=Fusarium pseudoanthophilum TaxID=48495 RepID=A0A8H5L5Y0_9HYPO|nr:hypothetical protein FPANT_7529 [Fusarium pseudoanthophilum]
MAINNLIVTAPLAREALKNILGNLSGKLERHRPLKGGLWAYLRDHAQKHALKRPIATAQDNRITSSQESIYPFLNSLGEYKNMDTSVAVIWSMIALRSDRFLRHNLDLLLEHVRSEILILVPELSPDVVSSHGFRVSDAIIPAVGYPVFCRLCMWRGVEPDWGKESTLGHASDHEHEVDNVQAVPQEVGEQLIPLIDQLCGRILHHVHVSGAIHRHDPRPDRDRVVPLPRVAPRVPDSIDPPIHVLTQDDDLDPVLLRAIDPMRDSA